VSKDISIKHIAIGSVKQDGIVIVLEYVLCNGIVAGIFEQNAIPVAGKGIAGDGVIFGFK
jgi:hypothetical protein